MQLHQFPVIDLPATGANIRRLRQTRGTPVWPGLGGLSLDIGPWAEAQRADHGEA